MAESRSDWADEPFFPDLVFSTDRQAHDFDVEWYSKHLKAMKEPSLWRLAQNDYSTTVYRLMWLPTFHQTSAVRLVWSGEDADVHAVMPRGLGGYEPGEIFAVKDSKLGGKEWEDFVRRLRKAKFWSLPTVDDSRFGLDGDRLILEGVRAGKYHIVDRWSPDADHYSDLCGYMLTLSDLDVIKTWREYRR
jgi:hypothetical protein